MKDKLVSIAMTTYNGEKFIKEQIESILNQTYQNLEIVICDDNSTDNTFEILREYAKKDRRIKLYKNEKNLGFVKNFEKAISLCKGDYIALSDQDDIWMKNKIEILLKEIDTFDLVHSDAYLINEKNEIISKSYSKFVNKYLNPRDVIELAFTPIITGCTCMFTNELKEKILPICSEIYAHDIWISLIAFKNNKIKYCDKPLIKYRQHSNNQIGALKQKTTFLNKIATLKNKNEIISNYRKFFLRQVGKIYCIQNNLTLTKEEKKYLNFCKKLFYYILKGNVKGLYYFFKLKNKLFLDKGEFEKWKFLLNLYIKVLILGNKNFTDIREQIIFER